MNAQKILAAVLIIAGGVLTWGYLHGHTRNLSERPAGVFAETPTATERAAAASQSAAGTSSGGTEMATTESEYPPVLVYKTATCGCCGDWIDHLREEGFAVQAQDVQNLGQIKERYGITRELGSCHTAIVAGYVVEGHVPAADIQRLLEERPDDVAGLAVPGMPIGSPGMEQGDTREPFTVEAFKLDGSTETWASHNQ